MTIEAPRPIIIDYRRDRRWQAAAFIKWGHEVLTIDGRNWRDLLTEDDYADAKQLLSPTLEGEYSDD